MSKFPVAPLMVMVSADVTMMPVFVHNGFAGTVPVELYVGKKVYTPELVAVPPSVVTTIVPLVPLPTVKVIEVAQSLVMTAADPRCSLPRN